MLYKKIIKNPLEKLTLGKKKHTTYYLTANLFYSGIHFAVRKKIIDNVKLYLRSELHDCPQITDPVSISIGYQTNKNTTFDLDNKAYFWSKVICDVLQEMKKLPDDSTKYIHQIHYYYQRGESELIFQINVL